MLSKEHNDLLTLTGPDTPMGCLFRRHWLQALLAEELPRIGSDSSPLGWAALAVVLLLAWISAPKTIG